MTEPVVKVKVLFCPFCRESFEDVERCPDHDIVLVPWSALRRSIPVQDDGEPVAWFSPRMGRGPLAASAAATLIGFAALPLGEVHGSVELGGSMLALAAAGSGRLWLVPAAALAQLAILGRRCTPRAMRSARVVLALLACVAPAAVLWAWLGAREAVALLAARSGQALQPELGAGALWVWLAALPGLYASSRLGGGRMESGR